MSLSRCVPVLAWPCANVVRSRCGIRYSFSRAHTVRAGVLPFEGRCAPMPEVGCCIFKGAEVGFGARTGRRVWRCVGLVVGGLVNGGLLGWRALLTLSGAQGAQGREIV
jgi:hypothetical protein